MENGAPPNMKNSKHLPKMFLHCSSFMLSRDEKKEVRCLKSPVVAVHHWFMFFFFNVSIFFKIYFNSNRTKIQFWRIWILTWVSSFFCFTTHNYFYQHFEHTAVQNFFGSKTISPVVLTIHSIYVTKKQLKLLLKVPQAQGKGLCPRSPHHKTNTVNQREEENS